MLFALGVCWILVCLRRAMLCCCRVILGCDSLHAFVAGFGVFDLLIWFCFDCLLDLLDCLSLGLLGGF